MTHPSSSLVVPFAVGTDVVLLVVALVVTVPLLSVLAVAVTRRLGGRGEAGVLHDLHTRRSDVERREQRLAARESRLDAEARSLEERASEVSALEEERTQILERTSGLSVEEARRELVAEVEREARLEAGALAREIVAAATAEAEVEARRILSTAVQRLAGETTADVVVSAVELESDDLKGRIIGREGRNIRAFESVTGVNVVVDDTPGAVLLSCFDPVRREAARITMEELLADGRIHPSRIEETHQRAVDQVDRRCLQAGEDACLEVGITDLHPELVRTMGRLHYRTSYGQNVLRHLVESAHAAGLLADEIGVARAVCVRAAFLHDIGKALTHEVEGSHAMVGAELARRHGECDDVVHAIEAHHNEVEPRTVEALLTQAADAISGGRPGARRESAEAYSERLRRLEEIAGRHRGVQKVYAMQSGRDLRVMVLPDVVDDLGAQLLAREIAKEIEHELTYPGQIKVTVVRESRAMEVAR